MQFFLRKFKGLTIRLQMEEDDTRRKITKGAEKSLSSWVSFLSSLQALPLSLSSCLTTGQTGRMGARYGCLALAAIRLVEQISFCVFELSGDGSTWEIAQPTVPESVTPNSWKANWRRMQMMHFFYSYLRMTKGIYFNLRNSQLSNVRPKGQSS